MPINELFGTAVGDDLAVAMDIAAAEALDTEIRQRVTVCRCETSTRRHFSYRPVEAALDVVGAELVVVSR